MTLRDRSDFGKRLTKLLGARVVHHDTLGEFHCAILTSPLIPRIRPESMRKLVTKPRYWTGPASEGWGGDQVFVLDEGGKQGIAWLTWWDSERDANEFRLSYGRQRGKRADFAAVQDGKLVVFGYGTAKDRVKAVAKLARTHAGPRKGKEPFVFAGAQASPR